MFCGYVGNYLTLSKTIYYTQIFKTAIKKVINKTNRKSLIPDLSTKTR